MPESRYEEILWSGMDKGAFKVIDLTHTLGQNIPPSKFPKFEAHTSASYDTDGAYARNVTMNEHLGTHVDAPSHMVQGKINIDKVPLSQLIGPAAVIDIKEKAMSYPDYRLNLDDIRHWEKKNGDIAKGAFVLLASGWDKWWYDKDKSKYFNVDANGKEHFPGIEKEVFEFLVSKRDIKGVGTDCFRPEGGLGPPAIPGTRVPRYGHSILFNAGKLIIENMRGLDLLPDTGALIILGVIPYQEGSGGQARIIGILP